MQHHHNFLPRSIIHGTRNNIIYRIDTPAAIIMNNWQSKRRSILRTLAKKLLKMHLGALIKKVTSYRAFIPHRFLLSCSACEKRRQAKGGRGNCFGQSSGEDRGAGMQHSARRSSLLSAVRKGHYRQVTFLIDAGYDLQAADELGVSFSPMTACYLKHFRSIIDSI